MEEKESHKNPLEPGASAAGGKATDLFSAGADSYAKYRPTYPKELYDYILQFVGEREAAWDCATGNGQAASALAAWFHRVDATDSSAEQLKRAIPLPNVHYQVATAENTPFAADSFDLITVATAYHWLNWEAFHREATRVGKPGAVVAVWAYNILRCDDQQIDRAIRDFYFDVMYPYWDKERRHVENAYATVAFDFLPLPPKEFAIEKTWTKEDVLGYISTWSAVQHYVEQNGASPLPLLEKPLAEAWKTAGPRTFRFPLFLKIGRVTK